MGGYAVNFTVYTMAMIGLICFAVFVYRKITDGSFSSKSGKYLSVEETMSLSPRKTLHVVRAGGERFLIASDIDRTTLLAKLNEENSVVETESDMPEIINKPVQEDIQSEIHKTVPEQKIEKVNEVLSEEVKMLEETQKEVLKSSVKEDAAVKNENKAINEDKIIAFEAIYPDKKQKRSKSNGIRVQRKRTVPQPEIVNDYKKQKLSPIKQIAKRINEL